MIGNITRGYNFFIISTWLKIVAFLLYTETFLSCQRIDLNNWDKLLEQLQISQLLYFALGALCAIIGSIIVYYFLVFFWYFLARYFHFNPASSDIDSYGISLTELYEYALLSNNTTAFSIYKEAREKQNILFLLCGISFLFLFDFCYQGTLYKKLFINQIIYLSTFVFIIISMFCCSYYQYFHSDRMIYVGSKTKKLINKEIEESTISK